MDVDELVQLELDQRDWANICDANGPATDVPTAFRLLLTARTPDEAEAAYWMLENHVVVQGCPTDAALGCVRLRPGDLRRTRRWRQTGRRSGLAA